MKNDTLQEILACLSNEKRLFYYFKDKYALNLLSYYVGDGKNIRDIKKSRFGKLLNRPIIKNILRKMGGGRLSKGALESVWPAMPECYRLTLGQWGRRLKWGRDYNQTSRTGKNLVLHLNFSEKHNRPYHKLISRNIVHPFKLYEHPIAGQGHQTLAWARMDMAFESDEALIEEIQNDWIRMALHRRRIVYEYENNEIGDRFCIRYYIERLGIDPNLLKRYVDDILKPHVSIWDEAMLAACLWFLKEEIGIGKIFYHTHATGNMAKGISVNTPPKSVYSRLPQKFCFKKTEESPRFLLRNNNRRIIRQLKSDRSRFYLLEI